MNYILILIYLGFVSGALYILRDTMNKKKHKKILHSAMCECDECKEKWRNNK